MERSRNKHLRSISVAVAVVMLLSVAAGVRSPEVVTGVVGSDVTLRFRFNRSRALSLDHIGVYYETRDNKTKRSECMASSSCPEAFTIYALNATVDYHLTNLSMRDSQVYYAVLYTGEALFPKSNRVQLLVREDNRTRAAAPGLSSGPSSSPSPGPEVRGPSRGLSPTVLTGAVLCPLLLLTAALLTVAHCLLRTREPKVQIADSSIPTVHERVVSARPSEAPESSLVYSFLDFPQRPPQVLGLDSGNDYATISYVPQEHRAAP